MGLTVDIDTGGTFTDGFFARGDEFEQVKVETTPHDLTVCFAGCIEEGAKRLGFSSTAEMLREVDIIRYSTTVGTNTMIQRSGPKLGLIVSKGSEKDIYSGDGDGELSLFSLVPEGMVAGISAGIGADGTVLEPDVEEVRSVVRRLLTGGARAIVVSLEGAFEDPAAERRVKEIIHQDYPKHYLGAVPVFISSELCTRPGQYERTNAIGINSYLHRELARYLYKAEEDLRGAGLRKPLLIIHSTGGAARVAKTTALHTYNSGPVAGFLGSLHMGSLYGLENIASVDMGGTSTDRGIIARGRYEHEFHPEVGGIPVNVPMIEVLAIGGGGGSVARADAGDGAVRVGPESAGALPGPACYGLGGKEPTVTDADLLLGFLDPGRFLGGRRALDRERAGKAMRRRVAEPLGVSVEEAALLVKRRVDDTVAQAIMGEAERRELDPDDLSLFIYGGAGSTHCCGFGSAFARLYTFPYSPVFSAFGASTLDVMHVYERALEAVLSENGSAAGEIPRFNDAVEEMRTAALRDLRGEGFGPDSAIIGLELEMGYADSPERILVPSPHLRISSERDVRDICEAFERESALSAVAGAGKGAVVLSALRLSASSPTAHVSFAQSEPGGSDPEPARTGEREVFWEDSFLATPVFDRSRLACGNVVTGPAVVEQDDTTCVLPAGRKLTIDRWLNGVIEYA